MRHTTMFLAASALAAVPAAAAEELKFGPAPSWVAPVSMPAVPKESSDAPVIWLLNDQQIRIEPGKVTTFSEMALQIQTSDGFEAGSITFPWEPSTQTVTVNKVHILRDGKVIDVLGAGQKFTTVRRESNLEAAMLDGTLTANLQPEGLRVGDIINVALTLEHADPIMKGHVETQFANWNDLQLGKSQARVSWPARLKMSMKLSDGLPKPVQRTEGGMSVLQLAADSVDPLLPPKNAPLRFQVGRMGEVTDFSRWAEVAHLMMPHFATAARIPASGPLREEVEKIRAEAKSEKERTEKALQLVQSRVRYVALLMGAGGYVPASAEETWSRRFGDCKGKSALLVAILGELGINAEPVLVHSTAGDILPDRLPMVSYFDHVIVRARIAGEDHWLDGTRSGDMSLDNLEVPNFGWGLPLVRDAELVRIQPRPSSRPQIAMAVDIDASAGVHAAAPFRGETIFRGDAGRGLSVIYAKLSPAQLDEVLRKTWKSRYDYVAVDQVQQSFDKGRGELKLTMSGRATIPWNDGWFQIPDSSIAYEPDFERSPGPNRDAPVALSYPGYTTSRTTIKLPPGFAAGQRRADLTKPVRETIAGVEYARTAKLDGDTLSVETSERALSPEIPYAEALSATARLKALADQDVYLRIPNAYLPTEHDLAALEEAKPASAADFIRRGLAYLDRGRSDEAIADFSEAIAEDPENPYGVANRGIAYAWKRDFESAEKDFKAAEALDPENEVLLRGRAFQAERKGEFKKAIEEYTKSLKADAGNSFALMRRASLYRQLGEEDRALADTDQLLERGTEIAEGARLLRANIFLQRGDTAAMVKEADVLVAEHATSSFALVAAGKVYAASGETEKSAAAFERALALGREPYIYINRAETRPASDLKGRAADIDAALQLEPDNTDALRVKARLLEKSGDLKGALEVFDRALAIDGDTQYLAAQRAIVLAKLGRSDEAATIFSNLRERAKEPAELNNLCWTKATSGILLESALGDCRAALELSPGNAAYKDSLGMVLLRLGRLDEALAAYNDALETHRQAASLMGRALVYARKGDKERAESDRAAAAKQNRNIESQFADYGLTL